MSSTENFDRDDFPPTEKELKEQFEKCKDRVFINYLLEKKIPLLLGDGCCQCPQLQRYYCQIQIDKIINQR